MNVAEGGVDVADGRDEAQRPLFERYDAADVRALIDAYPLAWVSGGAGAAIDASLLPLIGVYDADGKLVELIGHLMRSNPLYATLSRDPDATILFKGPDGYISPQHAERRDWAPTWNYAQVKIGARVVFDEGLTEMSLKVLIDAMEAGRPAPWDVDELGERYRGMLTRIIGFRATVSSLSGKFKLGQDEDDATLHNILNALSSDKSADNAMVDWMRRFNSGR